MPEQIATLPVGTKFRCARGLLWHVRGYVDDEYIIVRTWEKRRNTWRYVVEFTAVALKMIEDDLWKIEGSLTHARTSRMAERQPRSAQR